MKHPDATEWLLGNRDRSSEEGLLLVRLKFYPPVVKNLVIINSF